MFKCALCKPYFKVFMNFLNPKSKKMKLLKRNLKTVWLIIVVLGSVNSIMGQRQVNVPHNTTLNEFINGDTIASGARVDTNTTYVLERGQVYGIYTYIRLYNVPLKIKSAEGEGPPAIIFLKEMGQTIRTRGDLWLEDIYITGQHGPVEMQPIWGNIRTEGENTSVVIKKCLIEQDRGSALQVRNHGQRILIEDCVFGQMGYRNRNNRFGRLIDTREYDVKKIEVRNTSMYHLVDRIICNQSGGTIDSLIFNQNTGLQLQGYNGLFHLGTIGYTQITNNLFLNPKYMGDYSELDWDVGAILDNDNLHYLVTVDTILEETEFIISNNNFYYEDDVVEFFDRYDSVRKPEILAPIIAEKMGDDAFDTGWELEFTFDNPVPTINFDYLDSLFIAPELDPTPNNWPMPEGLTIFNFNGEFSTVHPELITGSTSGGQLGDLNWARIIIPTDKNLVSDRYIDVYPCPSNGDVKFSYSLEGASHIKFTIYDLTGKVVKNETSEFQAAGRNEHTLNLSNLPNNMYMYTIQSQYDNLSGKIILKK